MVCNEGMRSFFIIRYDGSSFFAIFHDRMEHAAGEL